MCKDTFFKLKNQSYKIKFLPFTFSLAVELSNSQWFEEPSSSLVATVSPEGRSSEVAGKRLARRDNGQWSMVNVQWSMVQRTFSEPCSARQP